MYVGLGPRTYFIATVYHTYRRDNYHMPLDFKGSGISYVMLNITFIRHRTKYEVSYD